MVASKKPTNAPGITARMNSGAKSHPSTAGSSSSTTKTSQPPSSGTSGTPSKSSSPSSKHNSKKKKSPRKSGRSSSGRTILDWLVFFLISLFVFYSVSICPRDANLEDPICYSLFQYRARVIEPYLLPPLAKAFRHPSVSPYVEQATIIQQRAAPYIVSAEARTRPYVRKLKSVVWDGAVVPVYDRYVLPAYYKHLHPHVLTLYSKVDPYVSPAYKTVSFVTTETSNAVTRTYATVTPYGQKAYTFVKPFAAKAYEIARPWVLRAYEAGKVYSIKSYEASKPHVISAYLRLEERVRRSLVELGVLKGLYVDKHVGQIWEKVVELSGNENTVSAHTTIFVAETVPQETAAETVAATTPSTVAEPEVEVARTSEKPVVAASGVEAEETLASASVTVTEEPSPSIVAEDQPSIVSSRLAGPALSSVMSLMEEVDASTHETTSSSSVDEFSLASSVIAASEEVFETSSENPAPTQASVPEPEAKTMPSSGEEADDDLTDFLSELGLAEDPVRIPEDDIRTDDEDDEPSVTTSLTPEESKAARLKKTAEKRADIVKRHNEWFEKIDDLIAQNTVAVRDLLDKVRNAGAKALYDKTTTGKEEAEEYKDFSDQDYEAISLVDGERVSGLMDALSAEGDKMLRGLESYLKKEAKAILESEGGEKELSSRAEKWTKVMSKVEERFSTATQELQLKVRKWFIGVKDIEIRECLEYSAQVKAKAERAQADLGLNYAWLDDVTYKDWQRYHDLMRRYRSFDEQVRLIQNGSHPEPPADPIVSALDHLQVEMEDLVTGWMGRARSLNSKAVHEVFSSPSPPAEEETEEPEVSILPVDPVPPVEAVDMADILIGKDKVQVEEALKGIPLEPSTASVVIGKDKTQVEEALKDVPVTHEEL